MIKEKKEKLGPKPKFRGEGIPTRIGSLFIDSGAHSLYNKEADTDNKRKDALSLTDKYKFFDLKKGSEFRKFLESYASFIQHYKHAVDYYVTLDAIYNPEKTWEITMLLEEEYGLKPLPVIHCHSELKWFAKYIERGHTFIGIGGLGQGITKSSFLPWADKVFHFLCPAPHKLPLVRTHGFAMTSWELLLRYPWWSVDSASWIKIAAYGRILIPHKRKGQYVFTEPPYIIGVSQESTTIHDKNGHVLNLTKDTRKIVEEWLDRIGTPLGTKDVWGVTSCYEARARANVVYFQLFAQSLPYPRPSQYTNPDKGFGLVH